MDLTTATPVEIDTVLARIMVEKNSVAMNLMHAREAIHRAADDKQVGPWGYREWSMTLADALAKVQADAVEDPERPWVARDAAKALERYDNLLAQKAALRAEAAPLNVEFQRRGGWTRAFLATSTKGHIHSSRNCSTCYDTTTYFWFTDLSGHDEAEIVTKAGSDACTVCYPSAPVNDLKRPRSIFSDDEKAAQQARVERDQAKADRLAKKIANGLTQDGSEFVVTYVEHDRPQWGKRDPQTGVQERIVADVERREHFKTEKAAVQWVVQYACWGEGLHKGDKAPGFAQVIAAVADKHSKTVAEVTAEIEAKIVAKNKRDNR